MRRFEGAVNWFGNVHIHTQPLVFDHEAQSTIYLIYHFLTFMLLHLKRGLQS